MVFKRERERAEKRAAAEAYGRDVQAALLVYWMRMDPSAAHEIASVLFDPSPRDQRWMHGHVRSYVRLGFDADDIVPWYSAGMGPDAFRWYKAGYLPHQARYVDDQIRDMDLYPEPEPEDADAVSPAALGTTDDGEDDEEDGRDFDHERRTFIKQLVDRGDPVDRVILVLQAGPRAAAEILEWLQALVDDPTYYDRLRVLAAISDRGAPLDPDDE